MFEAFLISPHHWHLSHSVSLCSMWLMFPLWHPLTHCVHVPSAQLRVSRSVFSLPQWAIPALVTSYFSPPTYPHLLTPLSIWRAAWPELRAALINTSMSQYHRDWSYGSVTACTWKTKQREGETVWPKCTLHVIAGGVHVDAVMRHARACGGVTVSLWQTLIIFNPEGILQKWKAAFQFYNPVDLISPPALVHTVQLDEQDWSDEPYSPQAHLQSLVVCVVTVRQWPSQSVAE